jgi:hypothetical protein
VIEKINKVVEEFSSTTHGSSDLSSESVFVMGANHETYAPLALVSKEISDIENVRALQTLGYVHSSLDYLGEKNFDSWYKKAFNKKLSQKARKDISIIHLPDVMKVHEAVEIVTQVYDILKDHKILINGKNLPVQLGEWYAKLVFGLKQVKSSSQRGFDFHFSDGKKVEVKIHWHDITSPKGVKLKKSLVELSDYTIVIYMAKNFMIRDVLFLDSDFIMRKFAGKGHTIFLKDGDVGNYFFSSSDKHYSKIVNSSLLLKFASPNFAMKLDEKINK